MKGRETMTSDELRQPDLEREFPGWRFEVGVDRLPYAWRPDAPTTTISGEDWTDLRDNIVARWRNAGREKA